MNKLIKSIICCLLVTGISLNSFCQTTIKMKRHGNVFILPCKVNGLILKMIFDTGADDVSISLTDAQFMMKNGYLSKSDIVGTQSYKTANGDIAEGTKIIIRKITFAGLELTNIEATIMPNGDAPLLLGQSAIRKLGKILLDPDNNTLTVYKGKGNYDYSKDDYTIDDPSKETRTYSYSSKTSAEKTLKEVLTLKIDRKGGANAAQVAWHPVQKKYYAAQAGNATFPLEVFDANGKMLSSDTQSTQVDIRGLWYNPNTKTLQMTTYNNEGWYEYKLNSRGMPSGTKMLDLGPSQPDAQCAGVYNPKKNVVYFYDFQGVALEVHNLKDGSTVDGTIKLHLGAKTKDEITEDQGDIKYNYSENAIIYTGMAKAEIGLLNHKEHQIELYDLSTGLMTQVLKLPEDAPAKPSLNFSYSNNVFWLFDNAERVWHGYKM